MATGLWQLLNDYKVIIPIIQRDYAQGREFGKVPLIRENILNAMFKAIKKIDIPLELDFVYGYTKSLDNTNGSSTDCFYPLDGQQRLTTLFLLHWFAAAKEGKLLSDGKLLSNFTYEIRHSSRLFCEELVKYVPDNFNESIKSHIVNQPWFFSAWQNDPTINSMLVMLDSIQNKFEKFELSEVWPLLTSDSPPILFHLLPTDKLGMPDDLYIKMNSRGKELTEFEYFKIRFSELLKNNHSDVFNHKIDQEWSDLFWDLFKEDNEGDIAKKVDDGFLKFFNFYTDMIVAEKGIEFDSELETFDRIEQIYLNNENIDRLFEVLNLMVGTRKQRPDFYDSYFYTGSDQYDLNKVRIFFNSPNVDLFKKCAIAYDPDQRNNPFSIGEQILLYACIIHLLTNSPDFQIRIRKLRNLITNSEDTVRKEYLTSLLKAVKDLIINGDLSIESRFNSTQIQEEKLKDEFLISNINLKSIIYQLEDHRLLQGCISVIGLHSNLDVIGKTFFDVFSENCRYVDISCALYTYGDYTQNVGWRNLLASSKEPTWRDLFTPSTRRGNFENTKAVLGILLNDMAKDPLQTIDIIIEKYLSLFDADKFKPKDWRYYFIKYSEFRYHSDGYYYWPDHTKQYESIMMYRTMLNGRHWDPVLFTIKKYRENCLSMENFGQPLIYVKGDISIIITNHNDHFMMSVNDSNTDSQLFLSKVKANGLVNEENKYMIKQDDQGVDIEDRILKGIEIIDVLESL